MDPTPATTQRGTPVPLWNPPHKKRPVLNSYGYSRRCVIRRIFRQVPIETCIPLRGRQAEYRRPPDYRLDKKTIFSGRAVSSLIQTNWEKESKTLVLAVFRFTFGRPKVNPGVWGRAAPTCYRIEWKLFGRRDSSPPPARRWADLSPSVPCAGTETEESKSPAAESGEPTNV